MADDMKAEFPLPRTWYRSEAAWLRANADHLLITCRAASTAREAEHEALRAGFGIFLDAAPMQFVQWDGETLRRVDIAIT